MQKQLLSLIFLFLSLNIFSQIRFEKGYFIDETHKKIECYIKNNDWISAPKEIEYKLSETGEAETRNFFMMNSFHIYNTSHYYIKSDIEFDRKMDNEAFIPKFETVVLKVILEGDASLYSLSNIYFYNVIN